MHMLTCRLGVLVLATLAAGQFEQTPLVEPSQLESQNNVPGTRTDHEEPFILFKF
jgi:hypothetical protein